MSYHRDTTIDKYWSHTHESRCLPLRSAPWREKVSSPAKFIRREPTQAPLIPFSCACRTLPFLPSDEEDSSSDSDSHFDRGSETEEIDETDEADEDELIDLNLPLEQYGLARRPEYLRQRPHLTEWTYDRFCDWKAFVQYAIPPGHRQPSRKRARGLAPKPRVAYLCDEDPVNPDMVIVSSINGYFHLACPFYRYNPVRYRQCMHAHDLQSIEDVINHLQRHHRLPTHCPICRRTFSDARIRDAHVRGRTCELRPEIKIEGIDRRQMSKILRRDDGYVREDIRWLRIFHRVFPTSPPDCSPYLTDGVEFEISLLRDYVYGEDHNCILDHIKSCGLLKVGEDKKELAAFFLLTLNDLVEKVLHNHETDTQVVSLQD